jgi:uncharacterized FlaG/YvyC family protein
MDVQPAQAVSGTVAPAEAPQAAGASVSANATAAAPIQQLPSEEQQTGLAPAIAKLFGGSIQQPVQLNVSYRVEGTDVVTVFTDPKTGKEIAQFPPEMLLGLAKFFDQQSGVTFDTNA